MIQEINTVIGLIKTWFMLEDLMYLLMASPAIFKTKMTWNLYSIFF